MGKITMWENVNKSEKNLLINGNFSELYNSGEIKKWKVDFIGKGIDGKYTVIKGFNDKNILKIECNKFLNTREKKWIILYQDNVLKTRKGKNLKISMWLKKENIKAEFIKLWIMNISPWAPIVKTLFPVSNKWQKVEQIVRPSKNSNNTRFEIFFTEPGILYVSDIVVCETDKSPISVNPIRKKMEKERTVVNTKNLVFNGSFEIGTKGWGVSNYDYSFLTVDDKEAYTGKKSLRLDFDKESLPISYSDYPYPNRAFIREIQIVSDDWIRVKRDKVYTLSLYIKSNKSCMPVKIGAYFMNDNAHAETVKVNDKWQRYALTFKAEDIFLFPGITAKARTFNEKLWIDAIQLEEGEKSTEFTPQYPCEAVLTTLGKGGIYYNNEDVVIKLDCFQTSYFKKPSQKNKDNLFLEIFDYRDKKIYETKIMLKHGTKLISLPLKGKNGHYQVKANVSGNGFEYKFSLPIAVIYPYKTTYPEESSWFGINHWYYTDLLQGMSKDAGVSWVRDWTLRWSCIESGDGKFNFEVADVFQKRAEKFKMKVLSILPEPTASWISSAPSEVRNKKLGDAYAQDWYLPKSFKYYARYVGTCMKRFYKIRRVWEIFNEPYKSQGWTIDNVYDKFLTIVNEKADETDKSLKVMRCGLCYIKNNEKNVEACHLSDLISEHIYPEYNSTEKFLKKWELIEKFLINNKIQKKIWVTEYGKYADDNPHYRYAFFSHFLNNGDERTASAYSIKYFTILLAHSVEKIFFHLRTWPLGLIKKRNQVDFDMLFKYGGAPRKFFVAANAFSWILRPGTSTAEPVTEKGSVYAYVFRREKDKVLIVWTDKRRENLSEKLKFLIAKTELYNMMGQKLEDLSSFEDEPVYICGKSSIIDNISNELKSTEKR